MTMRARPGVVGWLLFTLAIATCPALAASAGTTTGPSTGGDALWDRAPFSADPGELVGAASGRPAPAGTDVDVLFEETRYVFDDQGRCVTSHWLVSRILTTAGMESWGTTAALWSPWHQERPTVRARVIGPDGVAHELDPHSIEDGPASSGDPDIFDNRRRVRAPLPALAPGVVVEEQSILRDQSPYFDRGIVVTAWFGHGYPVARTRLVVEAPAGLPVLRSIHLLPDVVERREEIPGGVRLTFEQGPLAAMEEPEPFLPPEVPGWPSVSVTTGRSWKEVAAGYSEIVERQIAGADLRKLVDAAVGKAKARDEVVRALLKKMRLDVRYTGVEFDAAAIVPRTPAETLRAKYGDCKDQAALLVAMLRAAGIPANVALLQAGPGPDIDVDLPGLGGFDHAIVRVAGDPPLWIDPTSKYSDVGEVPIPDQGRLALVASGDTHDLERIPDAAVADNRVVESREFTLAEEGPSRVVEVTEAWGAPGRDYRAAYADPERGKIKENLERYVKERYLAKTLGTYETSNAADLSTPFRLRIETADASRGLTLGGGAAVAIEVGPIAATLPEWGRHPDVKDDATARTHDVYLPMVFRTEWQYRIVPPPGFEVQRLPDNLDKDLGPARFSCAFRSREDGDVLATLAFEVDKRRLTPGEAAVVQKGVRELRDMKPLMVTFQSVGEAHLEAGRIREALDEFRRLAGLHPKESLHRTQVARALLAGGMGEVARAEARGAVAAAPSSAEAQRILGWTLANDQVGRPFHKGCDLAGAEAAFRKAAELDASDAQARANLAILLEYDRDLTRYGPGARLEEAVRQYQALRDDLSDRRYDDNLLVDLARLKRYDEIRRLAATMDSGLKRNSALVCARAATEGLDGALKEASSLTSSAEDRRALLLSAGRWMLSLRLYPQAADLFAEAARGAANGAALLSLADILRKARPHEELKLSEDEPGGLMPRFMLTLANPAATAADYLAYFPKWIADRDAADFDINGTRRSMRAIWASLAQAGMSLEVSLDVAVAMLEQSVQGDDSLGYRIGVQMPGAATPTSMVLFAVREQGKCRMVAFDRAPGDMGQEVLRRLESGDLDGARRWLDWARDEVPSPSADDPFSAPPLSQFWSMGAAGDAEAVRLAAASLLVTTASAATAIPILQHGLERASSDADRLRFDHALTVGYLALKKSDEAIVTAKEAVRIRPDSGGAFDALTGALALGRRWDECRQAAEERVKRHPDDLSAQRAQASCSSRAGDFDTAERTLRHLVDTGKATAPDFNNLAWLELVRDAVTDATVDLARRAVLQTHQGNAASLHTLAAIYAEIGKPSEAREVILQSMDAAGTDEPQTHDWYVFGRIAEQYGVTEAAVGAYKKVARSPEDDNRIDSTYALAQRRLAALAQAERPKQRH